MNVKSVEKLEKSQVAVTVEVTAEEFEAAVQKAYLKMRNKISVPGFRPGKAPRKMIEKLYGEGVFYSDGCCASRCIYAGHRLQRPRCGRLSRDRDR